MMKHEYRLTSIEVENFRSLAEISIDLGPLSVLFGPNGSGKSSLLDAIWFVRDCSIRGAERASSARSHGIGLLWDGADPGDPVKLTLGTENATYSLRFSLASGRIDPHMGELLLSRLRNEKLLSRSPGAELANFYHTKWEQNLVVTLRDPEKLSLSMYLDLQDPPDEGIELDKILHFTSLFDARALDFHGLMTRGSESTHEHRLWARAGNLWSVLRNIHDRRAVDNRFKTIRDFMRKAFPQFDDLVPEQTGQLSVTASFLEKGLSKLIYPSGVSDGHLQLLILLTALFSEGEDRYSLLLFDEPEMSLHPWALAVFAEAVKTATESWQKQVVIATHSPVLISQFAPDDIFATTREDTRTTIRRVSELEDTKDLLEKYAAGSLYMAQALAPQSAPPDDVPAGISD